MRWKTLENKFMGSIRIAKDFQDFLRLFLDYEVGVTLLKSPKGAIG